jgi:hypothetical protein
MNLLDIPVCLSCEILSDWIETRDLGKLDSALCSRALRRTLLNLLRERATVSLGRPSKDIEDTCLEWLFSRKVKLLSLSITDPDVNFTAEDCKVFQALEYLDLYYRNRLRPIGEACSESLKVLILRGSEVKIESALRMAAQFRNLHTLEIGELGKATGRPKLNQTFLPYREPLNLPTLLSKSLKSFICNWPGVTTTHVLNIVTASKFLTRLELTGAGITDSVIYAIVWNCRDIRLLRLLKCVSLTTDGIVALASYTELSVLDLNGSGGVANESVIPVVGNNPSLRSINLRYGNGITSLTVMKVASSCPGLTALDVSYCKFVKDDALALIANKCRDLQDLQVVGCEFITDMSMLRLANMCPKLTSVNIKDCANVTRATTDAFAFSGVKPYKKAVW